eukprot:564500-Amphidinium_carterae.1
MLQKVLANPDIEIEYVSSLLTYEKECVVEECAAQDVTEPTDTPAAVEDAPARIEAARLESPTNAHPDPEQVILAHNLPKQPTRTN